MANRVKRAPASARPTGTVTFLFSDIEGSAQRWDRDRPAMQEAVRAHDKLMHAAIATQGGYVFKTIGDAFCAAFATPESAALAALNAQRELGGADFSSVHGLRVRMAINTGTADERDGDYFGPALNRVARLLSLGHGGQVLLSGTAADLVRANPPPQVALADLGEYELKDLEGLERVSQLVAPDLQRHFPELRSDKAREPWLVPDAMRTPYFTGRDELLANLRQQLVERHRAVLSGLGGVGKTQSAIEYAVRHRTEYPGGVFWINAETIGGLTGGFVAIATTLSVAAAASNDQEQIVKAALTWLNAHEGWLLIFDNVDDRLEIQPFVPERGKGDLLITSRQTVFAELGIPRALEMRDLDTEESVRFLLARTGREGSELDERTAAGELATELGNLPLALEQAAAYIAETSVAFSAYLGAFRKRRIKLLEKAAELVAHSSVSVTWAANFEAVERASPAAADVLHVSALLAPDAIPFELFLVGAHALGDSIAQALADPDELAMAELLRPLTRYSLVRSDMAARVFSLHRLVQENAWTSLAESARRTTVERAVLALDASLPEVEFATWTQCQRLVAHVASLAERSDMDDAQPRAAGRVLNNTGRYLLERGRYAEAQALLERALAIRERALGPDHPDVATSLNYLAEAHKLQGWYPEAQARYDRALAIRERALGPDHLDVAHSLNGLGGTYLDQARYDEAQALHERGLAIRERALGPDHPDVARSLTNVGLAHWKQGRYVEAQTLFERVQAICERALGPDHPDLARSLNNLAALHVERGGYAEAQPLLEGALAIFERALGSDHPVTAQLLDNLGLTHFAQGRHAEAQSMLERSLAIRERTLGPHHPQVSDSLSDLGALHCDRGRYAEAQPLLERALEIRESSLGPDHVFVAQALVGLASLRSKQDRAAEAIAFYERALAIKERTFGADNPELAEIRTNIGALRTAMTADPAAPGRAASEA
jgi:class 3 adenylate cyclase/tetratricopeptide (TPR) repeat protein